MENAVDALKMAFAVFVFVVALSITMHSFTSAKDKIGRASCRERVY